MKYFVNLTNPTVAAAVFSVHGAFDQMQFYRRHYKQKQNELQCHLL